MGVLVSAAERSARYPWTLLALLWVVSAINSADRAIVVAVGPAIRDEFGLSATGLALVNSTFFWVYAVAAFFAGRVGDAGGRTRVILIGLTFWSVATGMTPLSTGFAMLLGLRALVATGESTYYPTATALIGAWHRPQMRARALAIHQTGVFAGAALGAVAAGALADRFGWRMPFAVFGAAGLIWAAVLWRRLKDLPAREPAADAVADIEPYRAVLASRPALVLCAVFFLSTGATTGVTVWAPTYVHDMLGLSLTGSALYGSMPINLAGFVAVPVGGIIADALTRRSPLGRWHTAMIGLGVAGAMLLPLAWAATAVQVAAVLLATTVGKGLFDGCVYAAAQDVVAPHARATAVGMMTTCGYLGAGVMPVAVGAASTRLGIGSALAALAGCYVVAVLLLALSRRSVRSIFADEPVQEFA